MRQNRREKKLVYFDFSSSLFLPPSPVLPDTKEDTECESKFAQKKRCNLVHFYWQALVHKLH